MHIRLDRHLIPSGSECLPSEEAKLKIYETVFVSCFVVLYRCEILSVTVLVFESVLQWNSVKRFVYLGKRKRQKS